MQHEIMRSSRDSRESGGSETRLPSAVPYRTVPYTLLWPPVDEVMMRNQSSGACTVPYAHDGHA